MTDCFLSHKVVCSKNYQRASKLKCRMFSCEVTHLTVLNFNTCLWNDLVQFCRKIEGYVGVFSLLIGDSVERLSIGNSYFLVSNLSVMASDCLSSELLTSKFRIISNPQ